MSQALIATGTALRGRMLSFLLVLALAVIWHGGDGARSQQPTRGDGGMTEVVIHPDEGLRQIVHLLQKRVDDRNSGALPDPVVLAAGVPQAPRQTVFLTLGTRDVPPAQTRLARGKLARAPPVTLLS